MSTFFSVGDPRQATPGEGRNEVVDPSRASEMPFSSLRFANVQMCTELVEFDEKLSRLHAERGGLLELSKLADLQHLVRLFSFFIQWKKKDEAVNAETRNSLTYYVSPKFRRVVSSLLSFSCLAKRIMTAGLR
uniref:Uncharacterized protein n=1 Tax=Toxoplasma gondii TgCATBr9 TaxID=943120 RepID=A0A2T6IYP1_TOXGO|nr:hypothetical protein TGBR9_357810 [Toxoplasma gondii TgCATBr9]